MFKHFSVKLFCGVWLWTCLCSYTCVHITYKHTCWYILHMCMYVFRGQRLTSGVSIILHLIFKAGIHQSRQLGCMADNHQWSSCLCLPHAGIARADHCPQHFRWLPVIQTQVLCWLSYSNCIPLVVTLSIEPSPWSLKQNFKKKNHTI